jgi:hypothetical protein
LNSFIAVPLQAFFTLTESYNILVFLSFVLAGYGAYLLADYVLSDKRIAFACGFIYAFSPYHVHEVWSGALHLATIQWIPFFVLYLLKTLSEGGRNAVYAGFFLFLVSLSEWQYMGITLIYALLTMAYQVKWRAAGLKVVLKDLAIMSSTFILLIAAFAIPLVKDFLSSDYMVYSPSVFLGVSAQYSLDAASPLVPNFMNTFYGRSVASWLAGLTNPPYNRFVSTGYVVLALALLPALRRERLASWVLSITRSVRQYLARKTRPYTAAGLAAFLALIQVSLADTLTSPELKLLFAAYIVVFISLYYALIKRRMDYWSATAIVFFLLSLGPGLTMFGQTFPFPLPYFFFVILPPFRIFRAPYRFYVIVTLALALLAGKSLKNLASRRKNQTLFISLTLSLILLEYAALPFPVSAGTIPQVYEQIKADGGDFAVLEVPVMPVFLEENDTRYMIVHAEPEYYQTYHEKKLVGGYVSRYPKEQLRFLEETVLLRELRGHTEGEYHPSEGLAMLRAYNVRYVLLHRSFYSNETLIPVERLLEDTLRGNIIYDDGSIVAYKVV